MDRRQFRRQIPQAGQIDGLRAGQQFERDQQIEAIEKLAELLGGERGEGRRILLSVGILARQDGRRVRKMDDLGAQSLCRLEQWREAGAIGAGRGEQRRQVGE